MTTQFIYIMSFVDKTNKHDFLAFLSIGEAIDYAQKHKLTSEVALKSFRLIHNNNDLSNTDEKVSD